MIVKICGLSTVEAVRAAVEAGADAVGLVLAQSPRQVAIDALPALVEAAGGVPCVAVFRGLDSQADLDAAAVAFAAGVRVAQSETSGERPALPEGMAWLPAIRDGDSALRAVSSLVAAGVVEPRSLWLGGLDGALVYDGPAGGGAGVPADWSRAASIAQLVPMLLAGGLNADNVGEAIDEVSPCGVDVSSGVESAPSKKDPAKIRAFVGAARAEG